jgi:hypothetical protein
MSQTTQELKREIAHGRETLKTLRDEIRVKIHLAGMDARDRWTALSADVDKMSHELSGATSAALAELVARFRELAASLKEPPKPAEKKPEPPKTGADPEC